MITIMILMIIKITIAIIRITTIITIRVHNKVTRTCRIIVEINVLQ